MGDQSAASQGVTATTSASPELLPAPSNAQRAASRIRASRAESFRAFEESDGGEREVAKPSTPIEAKRTVEPEVEDLADDDTDDQSEVTATETVDEKPDPNDGESNKRIASIQAAEKRSREKIAEDRKAAAKELAALTAEREKLAAERVEFETWKKTKERAKLDPLAYLEAGGVDDLEYTAKLAYAKAKAGTEPANREAAARMQREREHAAELADLRAKHEALEKRLTTRDQQTEFESTRSTYLEHAIKSIGDDAPLSRALAEKNPTKLRAALWTTTMAIAEANDGDVPDPEDVIAHYEETRRAELEELGIDYTASAAPKKNNQPADKKHPAKTLGNDLSTQRVPRPTKSDKEYRAETLEMLESGKLE